MGPRIKIMTPEGFHEYGVYDDNRVLAADYAAGTVRKFEEVIYRGVICEIVGDFTDDDGERFCELLAKRMIERNVTFTIL